METDFGFVVGWIIYRFWFIITLFGFITWNPRVASSLFTINMQNFEAHLCPKENFTSQLKQSPFSWLIIIYVNMRQLKMSKDGLVVMGRKMI
jgi:hypothetical protein